MTFQGQHMGFTGPHIQDIKVDQPRILLPKLPSYELVLGVFWPIGNSLNWDVAKIFYSRMQVMVTDLQAGSLIF